MLAALYNTYGSTMQKGWFVEHVLWNVFVTELCAQAPCTFYERYCFGHSSGFFYDGQIQFATGQKLDNFGDFLRHVTLIVTHHGIFHFFECTTDNIFSSFVAVREKMMFHWSAPGFASLFPNISKSRQTSPLDRRFMMRLSTGTLVSRYFQLF